MSYLDMPAKTFVIEDVTPFKSVEIHKVWKDKYLFRLYLGNWPRGERDGTYGICVDGKKTEIGINDWQCAEALRDGINEFINTHLDPVNPTVVKLEVTWTIIAGQHLVSVEEKSPKPAPDMAPF